MIEREYNPALLAFVVDTSENMSTIKDQLILVSKRIESDEKAYIYHSLHNHIPRWPGEVVGDIANYNSETILLQEALKKIIHLWSFEDADASRYLFVIADKLEEGELCRVRNVAKKEINASWKQEPIKLFFLLFKSDVPESEDNLQFISVDDPANLGKIIAQHYKGLETPFLIEGYEPLDIEKIGRDYIAIKESFGKENESEEVESD